MTASVPAVEGMRVLVRSRGNQAFVDRVGRAATASAFWRFTPKNEGTCIIAVTAEPASTKDGRRTHQYDKYFLRVAPADPSKTATRSPSASATARFAHRLEIAPMVDPTWLTVGSDLPLRVKYDGVDLQNATIVATCRPDADASPAKRPADGGTAVPRGRGEPAPPPVRLNTGKTSFANLPIRHAGVWTVVVEHRPAPNGSPDRREDTYVALLRFHVPGDRKSTAEAGSNEESQPPAERSR